MKISQCMTRDVTVANPNDSIRQAAQMMIDLDVGVLPVGENDRLVGMITDRDIAVRAVAEGKDSEALVRDIMTEEVRYCFDDDVVDEVLENMGDLQVLRLPVVDRDKRLVGIVSLGDVAGNGQAAQTGAALGDITRPGGDHSQSAH
jgi:CBS domain-containing protein